MKTARLIGGYLRHNLMSAMAYREAFLMQVAGMMLNNAMLLFFWWVLFTKLPSLHGWDLSQVMLLYGIVTVGFGLANIVFGNCFRVARIITTGQLDYYLALPADPLTHLLVSRMSVSAWGDMLFGLIVFFLARPGRWPQFPFFLLLSVASGIVLVAFSVLMGSLAFWLGNADTLASQAVNSMITFGIYPLEIFPGPVQWLLYTVIPAAFVGAVPAGLLAHYSGERLLLLAAATVGLSLVARGVFQRGLRRYESGNLVIVRG